MSGRILPPRLVRHTVSSYSDSISAVQAIQKREVESIKYFQENKITSSSPRGDSIELIPSLQLCLLPDVVGLQRAAYRPLVTTEALPVVSELFQGGNKQTRRRCIVFQGRAHSNYLRRVQESMDAHVIVVEKTTTDLLGHIEGVAGTGASLGNFSFIRGNIQFVLHNLVRSSSVDNIVLSSPKPFPATAQSHARTINRDFYLMAHKALKVRFDENDSKGGLVTWTDYRPFWMFMHEQLDEAKLMVPFAKKKTSVFEELLPVQQDVTHKLDSLYFFAAHKKSATPAAADDLIDGYDYGRKYFRALFDSPDDSDSRSGEGGQRGARGAPRPQERNFPETPSWTSSSKKESTPSRGAW